MPEKLIFGFQMARRLFYDEQFVLVNYENMINSIVFMAFVIYSYFFIEKFIKYLNKYILCSKQFTCHPPVGELAGHIRQYLMIGIKGVFNCPISGQPLIKA
jgi:hypothetical protein